MAKVSLDEKTFHQLWTNIKNETSSNHVKINILNTSTGCFSPSQAASLLQQFSSPTDKLMVIRMLEPRLCRMSCHESKQILNTFTIPHDKLIALDCIKRCLDDSQTTLGEEHVLSAFTFEKEKHVAYSVLHTVTSYMRMLEASGGHQLYSPFGSVYTQSPPMLPHMYGTVRDQEGMKGGKGRIPLPPTLKRPCMVPAYKSHPTYNLPPDMTYQQDRNFPGNLPPQSRMDESITYPDGSTRISHYTGAVAPATFYNIEGPEM